MAWRNDLPVEAMTITPEEIARLRAPIPDSQDPDGGMEMERAWAALPGLLDEIERLRRILTEVRDQGLAKHGEPKP